MKIVLVRHGKPDHDGMTPVSGTRFGEWLRAYDAAPVDVELPPPGALRARAREAALLVTSPLRRSLESAALLAPDAAVLTEDQFRESALPSRVPTSIRLNPHVWTRLTRAAWLLGWSPDVEGVAAVRARARVAARRLVELASAKHPVWLVGHGILNGLIAGELRRAGWRGPRRRPTRYWADVVFERPAA
ncbi:MAG: histidine phosphatase family protein [Proteobacteria bacterium]|nr:histidine phosphatase family protein [Pseudomonadota bacterium]